MKEAVKVTKEAFRAWFGLGFSLNSRRVPVGQNGCGCSGCQSKNMGVGGVRGEGEAMEKDSRLAKPLRQLRKGKRGMAVFSNTVIHLISAFYAGMRCIFV